MTDLYPVATQEQIEEFWSQGFLVVRGAVDPPDLARLEEVGEQILGAKEKLAFDWAWEEGKEKEERAFRIVQSTPTPLAPELAQARFRTWARSFASSLLGWECEFWYDQFLAKPPRDGARTPWHQDEGYWGRNLDERGITCWLPLHDIDEESGCMHFLPGGHLGGVRAHHRVEGVQSDLLTCEVEELEAVACPVRLGDVTFHHGKTPHMTTPNRSDHWRRALSQHFRVEGSKGEGDHYPWKIYVNQFTGERIVPRRREA